MANSRRQNLPGAFDDGGGGGGEIEQVDAAIYGEMGAVDAGRRLAEAISIDSIHPDPAQPRRAIPAAVRSTWSMKDMPGLIQHWEILASGARIAFPIDTEGIISGEKEMPDGEGIPVRDTFMRILALAANIHREGLINPITVSRIGREFMIETGEGRWLAYQLLRFFTQDARYGKIAAHVVERSVWRQAAENSQRDDLNTIGKARQFALLLMDLYQGEGVEFMSYEESGYDHAFYSQVADGEQFRIPRNSGERLVNAMGLKNPSQLRYIRQALNLPPQVWNDADEGNWSVLRVREFFAAEPDEEAIEEDGYHPGSPPIPLPLSPRAGEGEHYPTPLPPPLKGEREKSGYSVSTDTVYDEKMQKLAGWDVDRRPLSADAEEEIEGAWEDEGMQVPEVNGQGEDVSGKDVELAWALHTRLVEVLSQVEQIKSIHSIGNLPTDMRWDSWGWLGNTIIAVERLIDQAMDSWGLHLRNEGAAQARHYLARAHDLCERYDFDFQAMVEDLPEP